MIEYTVVTEAPMFPMVCFCGSSKGPFVDTHYQSGNRHIYICKLCVKRAAKPFGFMPGEKADQLENAANEIKIIADELVTAHNRAEDQARDIVERDRRIKELQETLEGYRGIVDSQRHVAAIIKSQAEELQAVGVNGLK